MAITPSTYSITGEDLPYTAAGLADLVRDAFIAAGWMTAWHDSFLSGSVENRILKVTHKAGVACGITYYWFQFTGANMFYALATGWNVSTHVPTGSTWLDFISTTTNATTNHMRFASLNAAQSITIKAYKDETTGLCVLLVVNGSTRFNIVLDNAEPNSSFIDLSKKHYAGLYWFRTRISGNVGYAGVQSYPFRLRKTLRGEGLRANTDPSVFGVSNTASEPWEPYSQGLLSGYVYGAPGNNTNDSNNFNFGTGAVIPLDINFPENNTLYSTTDSPPFVSARLLGLMGTAPSAEFAIIASYTQNSLTVGSRMVISIGVEEYEVITVTNSANLGTAPTMIIAARVV